MEQVLASQHSWIIFFGAFFFGETLIIPAAALAAHGHFGVFAVAGWAYLGTVVSDALWFLLARPAHRLLSRRVETNRRYELALRWVDRRFGKRPEMALLFIKFVYGTRIATISYLSMRGLKLRRFAALNGIGTGVWIVVIVAVGWLAGKGIASLGPRLSKLELILPLMLLFALALAELGRQLSRRALKGKEEIHETGPGKQE